MAELLVGVVVGALVGIAAYVAFVRLRSARATDAPPAAAPAAAPSDTSAPEQTPASRVAALGRALSALADDVGHPDQLSGLAEFQALVAALREKAVSTTQLGQYATGDNWSLACAAYTALSERADRQTQRDAALRDLPSTGVYALYYALSYLCSLEERPPVGASVLAVQPWWVNNATFAAHFQDHFKRRAELGDPPTFGDALDKQIELDSAPVVSMLRRIQHPFAPLLLAEFNAWLARRVDRDFLSTVGSILDTGEADPLLVPPTSWQELLAAAEESVGRPRPRSILVCGDPQVGKTSFIHLLAARLKRHGWTLFAASGNDVMAGQVYIGELEGRVRKLVESLNAQRRLIWYISDLPQMAVGGSHRNQPHSILDQVLPAIAAGQLIIIGECSQAGATRLFQARPSLRSLMEVVPLQPMDDGQTQALAGQVGHRITQQTNLKVPEKSIGTTMELAQHYLGSGRLPGTVLELLKRAADRSLAGGDDTLTDEAVVATLSQISGLPAVVVDTNQRVELAGVQEFFGKRVIGQPEAVGAIVDRIAMLKAGLVDPGRPIGVFLFAGPTGTGKTELAKTLAEFLFGSADRMIRLDMSEFQAVESTSKILGNANDGRSESLAERIRKQPFSVVLLDEFEKANPSCWDLFLQVFDDGRLTDSQGNEVDFRHCIIILTSNLGATTHRGGGLGFRPDANTFAADQVVRAVSQTFRPEFVNRLDKVIVFRPLSRELMRDILHKELARVQERRGLRDRAWAIEWESSAIEFLLDRGFSPEMGARPLKRAIDQLLLAPLAATLVEHRFPQGDQFLFVRSNGRELEVEFVDPDAEPAGATPSDEIGDGFSLPAIILAPHGSTAERNALSSTWRDIEAELSGDPWRSKVDRLRLALADPAIWTRDDRHVVFSGLELADRIGEAARTAGRLYQRYGAASDHPARASRELAGRLALQLHNLRHGMDDFLGDAPVDALIHVERALEGGDDGDGWTTRLTGMYRHWATRRRMHVEEYAAPAGAGAPILLVSGFGAFRIASGECGLHVLEDDQRVSRRTVARVTAIAGPDRDLLEAGGFRFAAERLSTAARTTTIIRRYREAPAPLVRDMIGGWRSGRLSSVLGGDFDLIGAIKQQVEASARRA
jgi:ATP-dependent Clp protease ATP-binding subunit ClpC